MGATNHFTVRQATSGLSRRFPRRWSGRARAASLASRSATPPGVV